MSAWPWPFNYFGRLAFAETTEPNIDRANVRFIVPPDSRHYLTHWSRKALNDKAEWLFQNFGIVKEGVNGISRHTIGKGVSLQIDSEDSEWNELAERDFETYAMTPERCDLAGRRDFYEMQGTAIEQRLVRGEFFAALTENPDWGTKDNPEPCFQLYDSEEVGQPFTFSAGTDPRLVIDGVELNQNSRPIAYWLRKIDGSYSRIDRARMIHWYKPHAINQTRGITDFAQSVNTLVDIYELKRLATRSAKAQQLLALSLKGVKKSRKKGAFGAVANSGVKSDGSTPDPDSAQIEQLVGGAGGGIIYLDDTDGEAKLIQANSPSPLVEPYVTDLLMRDACASWGVPVEFFWNPSKMNGNTIRFVLARADLFFQILGERLTDRFCNPGAFRYLSHRVQIGKLRACKDENWSLKMDWQLPARMTVDNGRENQILIELLGNGLITMREYCNARGLSYKSTMRQWIREPIEFLRIAQEEGAPPEMLAMWKANPPMWRASKPGALQTAGNTPEANREVTAVDENGDPLKAAA